MVGMIHSSNIAFKSIFMLVKVGDLNGIHSNGKIVLHNLAHEKRRMLNVSRSVIQKSSGATKS